MNALNITPPQWKNEQVRIAPLSLTQSNLMQKVFLKVTQYGAKSEVPLNVFGVLARLDKLFPNYLFFMKSILFKGNIGRVDKELIILRIAWKLQCSYEWKHHTHFAAELGIENHIVESITLDHSKLWDDKLATMVNSVDALLTDKTLNNTQFQQLKKYFNDDQIVEFCMLVGHYVMVAMTINTCGVQPEND